MKKNNFEIGHLNFVRERIPKEKTTVIPSDRSGYLKEISYAVKKYRDETEKVFRHLQDYESLARASEILSENMELKERIIDFKKMIPKGAIELIETFDKNVEMLRDGTFKYKAGNKEFKIESKFQSLAGNMISRIGYPRFLNMSEKYKFVRSENLPGEFPFSQGIFSFKRNDEDPKRMFAGEGGPERTNKRFHYLSKDDEAKRLSTAFDSVTLYGEDPDKRPDIFGKIGEAGVSIATLNDMELLFKGFDLKDSKTSVSMTINGPASIILAMFMTAAIKQNLKGDDFLDEDKRVEILRQVRGTVQADILKEDQAQNTCIFSLEFSLK